MSCERPPTMPSRAGRSIIGLLLVGAGCTFARDAGELTRDAEMRADPPAERADAGRLEPEPAPRYRAVPGCRDAGLWDLPAGDGGREVDWFCEMPRGPMRMFRLSAALPHGADRGVRQQCWRVTHADPGTGWKVGDVVEATDASVDAWLWGSEGSVEFESRTWLATGELFGGTVEAPEVGPARVAFEVDREVTWLARGPAFATAERVVLGDAATFEVPGALGPQPMGGRAGSTRYAWVEPRDGDPRLRVARVAADGEGAVTRAFPLGGGRSLSFAAQSFRDSDIAAVAAGTTLFAIAMPALSFREPPSLPTEEDIEKVALSRIPDEIGVAPGLVLARFGDRVRVWRASDGSLLSAPELRDGVAHIVPSHRGARLLMGDALWAVTVEGREVRRDTDFPLRLDSEDIRRAGEPLAVAPHEAGARILIGRRGLTGDRGVRGPALLPSARLGGPITAAVPSYARLAIRTADGRGRVLSANSGLRACD